MSVVDQYDPEPFYRQLAAILRDQIKAGDFAPGDTLPSETRLQQEHGVSRGTVRAAIKILKDEGLVMTMSGRGTVVPPKRKR